MKQFIFGILTYNQENYVLETLESIKYQKIHYGSEKKVSLIITDDASKESESLSSDGWKWKTSEGS